MSFASSSMFPSLILKNALLLSLLETYKFPVSSAVISEYPSPIEISFTNVTASFAYWYSFNLPSASIHTRSPAAATRPLKISSTIYGLSNGIHWQCTVTGPIVTSRTASVVNGVPSSGESFTSSSSSSFSSDSSFSTFTLASSDFFFSFLSFPPHALNNKSTHKTERIIPNALFFILIISFFFFSNLWAMWFSGFILYVFFIIFYSPTVT